MSANDQAPGTPVALLARSGPARDRLKQALLEAGGHLVLEEDPNQLTPAALQSAAPAVALVALEPAVEDALERLEPMLIAAQVNLIFDEADLAARREGWDAQRWVRHLAVKLQGHGNVMPPGQEEEAVLPPPGQNSRFERPATRPAADASLQFQAVAAAADTALQFHDDDPSLQFQYQYDDTTADASYVPPPNLGRPEVPTFEELMAQAATPPSVPVAPPAAAPPTTQPPPQQQQQQQPPPVAANRVVQAPSNWSLAQDDAYLAPPPLPPLPGSAAVAPAAVQPVAAPGVSALSLEDLEKPETDAGALGAVLVLAGIGGPDAVRRLLAALPPKYPLPVLVQMRLDGGLHANLVKQIARVTTLPVALAAAGQAMKGGNVYILHDDIGMDMHAHGLRFVNDTGPLLHALPVQSCAVMMLSGADPALVPAVLDFARRGGWVAGQSGEGCYDPAAASQLEMAGCVTGTPEYLASQLLMQRL